MSQIIDLLDFTFNIPLKIESEDRLYNTDLFLEYIMGICKTNIIIYENDTSSKIQHLLNKYPFIKYKLIPNDGIFHRTRFLNMMAKESETPFVINCDIDCIVSQQQFDLSAQVLRTNQLDVCNPFDQCTQNLYKKFHNIIKTRDLSKIHIPTQCYCENNSLVALGGIVMWNKKKFVQCGMENENFISWGPEDWERIVRAQKLEIRFAKIKGNLFHLQHSRSANSTDANPYYAKNQMEYSKIKAMNKKELEDYISTWNWVSEK